jgi:hypothetical protein
MGTWSRATNGTYETHGTYVFARRLISPMCPISRIRGSAARALSNPSLTALPIEDGYEDDSGGERTPPSS